MFSVSRKYVTVFQPEIRLNTSEKIIFATLSTSKKEMKDGVASYENTPWQGRFVGDAFEPAKALRNGDKIDVVNGIVEKKYVPEKGREYVWVTVFDFAMSDLTKHGEDNSDGEQHEEGQRYADINGDSVSGGK